MSRSAIISIPILMILFAINAVTGVETNVPVAMAPFDARAADDFQHETAAFLDEPIVRTIDLGGGTQIELILIPAGEFEMGSDTGERDECPALRL